MKIVRRQQIIKLKRYRGKEDKNTTLITGLIEESIIR